MPKRCEELAVSDARHVNLLFQLQRKNSPRGHLGQGSLRAIAPENSYGHEQHSSNYELRLHDPSFALPFPFVQPDVQSK
jgi:hypothetical protein